MSKLSVGKLTASISLSPDSRMAITDNPSYRALGYAISCINIEFDAKTY